MVLGFGAIGESALGALPDESPHLPSLVVQAIIIPERKTDEGILLSSTAEIWKEIVRIVGKDWSLATQIPWDKWEEIVAGAFSKDGFDEVTLTPRSGDSGRDVIAIKNGRGCIKVIDSVKAFKPGHLVDADDVRALYGVLSAEQNACKGIVTTTSDFAPLIREDKLLKPLMPYRLELMNGEKLREWLQNLSDKD